MAEDSKQETWSGDVSPYVRTHCGTCAYGWVRRGADGAEHFWCLMDLAPAWPLMEYCSRYTPERRDPKPNEPADLAFGESGNPEQKH